MVAPVVDGGRPEELERPREPEQREHADLPQLHPLLAEVDREDLVEDAERKAFREVEQARPRRACCGEAASRTTSGAVGVRSGRRVGRCASDGAAAREAIDGQLAAQVRQQPHRVAVGKHDPVVDLAAALGQERVEVGDRAQVHVGRVVPLVGQRTPTPACARAGSAARCDQWPKLGNDDDRVAADAQHLVDDVLDVVHRLQRLREHHDVERGVLEAGEPALEVALDHVDAVGEAREHALRRDLHAVAVGVALAGEEGEQAAVAAAQVEHARAFRHPARDRRVVRAPAQRHALLHRLGDRRPEPERRIVLEVAGDAVEVGAHHGVVLRIVEQEGVVAVRRVDLRVGDVAAVVDQRLDDLARARRREAPVGGEGHDEELADRALPAPWRGCRRSRSPGRSSRAPW